ncbi:lactococcin 972 family bacteriocin [Shouchella lonarensis]|uniref:Bacteriocin (Lactococcin_972) n=1 Tax=Shouchella lonarensis TaxID=1464122 RepID=A0A1G6HEZ7_9BACI|nr:lactococcin 972 family bacteriocin [Shouchella lonarensis]SDB92733.1 Bacteriocin (Lactococcin_972) [Shouchella lonarensis]
MRNLLSKSLFSVALAATLFVPVSEASANGVTGGFVDLTDVKPLSNDEITPFWIDEKVGGGTWKYRSGLTDWGMRKYAESKYDHPSKTHGASAKVGGRTANSSCAAAGKTAHAKQVGNRFDYGQTRVTWNTSCRL